MLIEFGNARPHERLGDQFVALADNPASPNQGEPAVTRLSIPDDYTVAAGTDVHALALHLAQNPDITNLPDNEAFVCAIRTWPLHGAGSPAWVWSDNVELERLLSEFYGCPAGRPDDVEATHWTLAGPPGVAPSQASSEE